MHKMDDFITAAEPLEPRLPFLSSFAAKVTGGGQDDDEDDEVDDDDEDDDDPDADKSDDELRDELKKVREALAKANGQSAKRRKALRAKEAELEAERTKKAKKKPADDGKGGDEVDLDEAIEQARREGERSAMTRAKKAEAKTALLAAGVNPDRAKDAVALVNLDELDLDDDGLDGIDDEIERLRDKWPELFPTRRKKRESVVGRGDRDGDEGRKPKPKTASQIQAEALTKAGAR